MLRRNFWKYYSSYGATKNAASNLMCTQQKTLQSVVLQKSGSNSATEWFFLLVFPSHLVLHRRLSRGDGSAYNRDTRYVFHAPVFSSLALSHFRILAIFRFKFKGHDDVTIDIILSQNEGRYVNISKSVFLGFSCVFVARVALRGLQNREQKQQARSQKPSGTCLVSRLMPNSLQ